MIERPPAARGAFAISPAPSPAQAAAIVAALDCFEQAAARPGERPAASRWARAARLEAAARRPGPPEA